MKDNVIFGLLTEINTDTDAFYLASGEYLLSNLTDINGNNLKTTNNVFFKIDGVTYYKGINDVNSPLRKNNLYYDGDKNKNKSVKDSIKRLTNIGANVLGVVMTQVEKTSNKKYSKYAYYSKNYQEGGK